MGLPHIINAYVSLIFTVELFRSSCVTVTQSPCNISPLFPIVRSTLLLALSHWWTIFLCVNVTQVLSRVLCFISSNWNLSRNCFTLLCITLTQGFILSIWAIYDPFLFLRCVGCHSYYSLLCKCLTPLDYFSTWVIFWPIFGPASFKLVI